MKSHVNASGFPLQIGLKNAVDHAFSNNSKWRTVLTEHAWSNPSTGDNGFIDLVISNTARTQFFVVECKRVKDTSWIFLRENRNNANRRHAKCFLFRKENGTITKFGWEDIGLSPSTQQSKFCVIPGTDNRSKSLIERTAAELVASSEALAHEFKKLDGYSNQIFKIFFNVIVTTATLQVCAFDPSKINISDGTIENTEFQEVPYLRFRKQVSTLYDIPPNISAVDFGDFESWKESTVFVVNSNHFIDFLEEFELDRLW